MSNSLKAIVVVFIALALVAIIIDNKLPERLSHPVQEGVEEEYALSFSEFDEIVVSPVEKISAVELADFLIKQQHHYNFFDLRNDPGTYQIPSSERLSIQDVLDKKIAINETIILYSNNETRAIQLYYLLKIRGYFKVKVLSGGLQQWHHTILQPNISYIPTEKLELRKKLTDYFGGQFSKSDQPANFKKILIDKKIKKHHGC